MSSGLQLYAATTIVYFAVYAIAAMGLSIQYSYAGIVNLAFVVFQAAGAYTAAVLTLGPDTKVPGFQTYILGLEQSQLFRGLSPIAGALHLVVDQMLREGRGKDTPIFVIHGVHDFIFPVTITRQTCELLKQIGYNVTYEELPEWGHAFPYSINERLVLPWFEALPPKQSS